MLTRCPYPDCSYVYEAELAAHKEIELMNAACSQCGRLGRAKSAKVIHTLQLRAEKHKQAQNLDLLLRPSEGFQIILEDIRSLWNVGSIFRTADAVGISMLYLSGITGCPPRSEIAKTALGAEDSVPWQYTCHPLDIIPVLIESGVTIVGLERNSQSISLIQLLKEKELKQPLCLVVGNENHGLSPETLQSCHYICDLAMKGTKESLNAAVALAVAAYFVSEFI